MPGLIELSGHAFTAIASLLLAAACGALLARFGIVDKNTVAGLSKIVFSLMLPCLLFTKVSSVISVKALRELYVLPLSCVLYVALGLLAGAVAARILRLDQGPRRILMTASAFGNSGYIPIPLVAAVAMTFPFVGDRRAAEALGISYISIYLILNSPLLWTIGLRLLSVPDKSDSTAGLKLGRFITPPVAAMIAGVAVGLTPSLKSLLCAKTGLLHPAFSAMEMLSAGTIPCALVVLGASLAGRSLPRGNLAFGKLAAAVILTKLVLIPAFAVGLVALLLETRLMEWDIMLILVLIVEAATPPATNLALICALGDGKLSEQMGAVLFWSNIAAIPLLGVAVTLAFKLFL